MKTDTYIFNVDDAKKYGINEAIFLANMKFWITQNKANGRNFREGRYWTYNSYEAFQEIFPFWSARQIRTIIDKLVELKVILKENKFNKQKNDHTNWYAFVNEDEWINVKALEQKIELTNLSSEEEINLWSDENVKQNEENNNILDLSDKNVKQNEENNNILDLPDKNVKQNEENNNILDLPDENVKQNQNSLDKKVSPPDEKVKSDLTNLSEHYQIYTQILNTDIVVVTHNCNIDKICFDFNDTDMVNKRINDLFKQYVNTLSPHWANVDMVRNELLFDPRPELNRKICWIIILKAFMEYPSWNKQFQNVKSLIGKIKKLKERYLENYYLTQKRIEMKQAAIQRAKEIKAEQEQSINEIEIQLQYMKDKLNSIKNIIPDYKYDQIMNLINQKKWMQAQTEILSIIEE